MHPEARQQDASQALIFLLGGGQFGLDILQVQEIRDSVRPTPIPSSPPHFRGVINLRGEFVPVVDLRVKLGIAAPGQGPEGVTIILNVGGQRAGIVVDSVSEVLAIAPGEVRQMPATEYVPTANYVRGLVKHGDSTVVLLDIERLLPAAELEVRGLMQDVRVAGGA
jgi:purine-binding chemotaxis protein CheW